MDKQTAKGDYCMKKGILCFTCMAMLILSACGFSSTSAELKGDNGACVQIDVDKVSGAKIEDTDTGATITLSSGSDVDMKLISSSDADALMVENYDNGTFAEMSANDGTGFVYDSEGVYVHVIPMDDVTYLYMSSEDETAIFDVESTIRYTIVSNGLAENDFADQVKENGVSDPTDSQTE